MAALTIVDPKQAKRIMANRESAHKSRERQKQYSMELERSLGMYKERCGVLQHEVKNLQTLVSGLTEQLVAKDALIKELTSKGSRASQIDENTSPTNKMDARRPTERHRSLHSSFAMNNALTNFASQVLSHDPRRLESEKSTGSGKKPANKATNP